MNKVKNVDGELRMNNIHNSKKVKIEEDDKFGQQCKIRELRKTNQQLTGVKEGQQKMTGGLWDDTTWKGSLLRLIQESYVLTSLQRFIYL